MLHSRTFEFLFLSIAASTPAVDMHANEAPHLPLLETYCFDCHDADSRKGGLDLVARMEQADFDGTMAFENLVTGKMPPSNKKQPSSEERDVLIRWLVDRQATRQTTDFRRKSRHEFVHAANDLLGTNLDLAHEIPEDRGTCNFDSDRRIRLTQETLGACFAVADQLLEAAFPANGFPPEQTWVTRKVKDSHETYNIYHRPYKEGTLFSWTRANNGNSYSFFYDQFEPLVAGWYELGFEAAKVGEFPEDISVLVFAGNYYYADDRPQPQRLLGVISLGHHELETHRLRAYLHPGENVSVHCYSKHNFRQREVREGAYIRQLKVRGPLLDAWPPTSYQRAFAGLQIDAPLRRETAQTGFKTRLQQIGGAVSVSSFQAGMEKERLQDGSNKTFWHTRFKPTLAEPPHFVILENPRRTEIPGLSYATWSGGNGNGLVKTYEIQVSNDGTNWSEQIMSGSLETRLANEQPIIFPQAITNRFVKFLITDSKSLDGRSLASIGKLDVILAENISNKTIRIAVRSASPRDLDNVILRFAERAFATRLAESELAPYLKIGQEELAKHRDVVQATRAACQAILCSPRFLMVPGEHHNQSFRLAADLARTLWLSVPDEELLELCMDDRLTRNVLHQQIQRMLADSKAKRMVHSFCSQWLNLRSLKEVTPSLKLYPQYDDLLDHFLPLETEAYLQYLIRENLPVNHLIDSDFSFLNQRLAQHYGIDEVYGQQLRKVTFSNDVPRGGLLTMGSVLKVTTDGYDTSPILRGAWISRHLIGLPLSPPPESVEAIEPGHGETAATLREQIEQHKENKTCYACHQRIDPFGFALENFDATGQWRERYRIKLPHRGTFQYRPNGYFKLGGAVDPSGKIENHAFDDIHGLKQLLLDEHRKIAYNFARKFYEYASGTEPDLGQRRHLFRLIPERAADCRIRDLISNVLIYAIIGESQ